MPPPAVLSVGFLQPSLEQILAVIRQKPWIKYVLIATGAGLALSPFLVTAIVGALGFGAAGIVAGSPAAAIMASYGGAVTAGSVCAILQSIGAAGLSSLATAITSIVGGVAAGGAMAAITVNGEEEEDQDGHED